MSVVTIDGGTVEEVAETTYLHPSRTCGLHVKCPPQAHILEPFCFNGSPEQRLLLIFYGTSFYNFICI